MNVLFKSNNIKFCIRGLCNTTSTIDNHIRKLERIFMGNTPIGCINNSKILKCEENE